MSQIFQYYSFACFFLFFQFHLYIVGGKTESAAGIIQGITCTVMSQIFQFNRTTIFFLFFACFFCSLTVASLHISWGSNTYRAQAQTKLPAKKGDSSDSIDCSDSSDSSSSRDSSTSGGESNRSQRKKRPIRSNAVILMIELE